MICPLHGPILKDNLSYYIEKYDIWSSYKPETEGIFIAYASIHGNTKEVSQALAKNLEESGIKVAISDVARCDMAEAIEDAFKYDRMVLAASSYDSGVFTPMEEFLNRLKSKNYQNRKVGIIENGTWAPTAARCMKEVLGQMKNIEIIEPIVTIKSKLKEDTEERVKELAENLKK